MLYNKAQFADDTLNFIIMSTTGDGEPPDNAINFYNDLMSGNEELCSSLKNKRYGVLGISKKTVFIKEKEKKIPSFKNIIQMYKN